MQTLALPQCFQVNECECSVMCLFNTPPKSGAHRPVTNPSYVHQLLPCRVEESCSRVATNAQACTFIFPWEGLLSSSPLNFLLALIWTLREGCLWKGHQPELDVFIPSPICLLTDSHNPSFAFPLCWSRQAFAIKDLCSHCIETHTLRKRVGLTWDFC